MGRAHRSDSMEILDELVNFHASKFIQLEQRRIRLHALSVDSPVATVRRMEPADRESILAEIGSIEHRLDQLREALR